MTQRQSLTSSRQQLRHLGAALEAATPSLSSTSLLVEASPEEAAQMERGALGRYGVCVGNGLGLAHAWQWTWAWKKISVIMDISVLRFYGYIGYIGDLSADILGKNIDRLKIVKNSWKCKENFIII